jgi:hypothetical protein
MESNLEYKEQAAKCLQIACRTRDPELRNLLRSMAHLWLLVAEKTGSISAPTPIRRGAALERSSERK